MSQLPIITEDEASVEVAEIYKDIRRGFQIPFIPNFFRAQAASPEVLSTTWHAVKGILVNGKRVPRTTKEMIFVAVADARKCRYCESAHLAFCKVLGVEEETRNALTNDLDTLVPKSTQDIVKFAIKVATDPTNLVDKDYEIVKQHGVSDAELMEIIAMASLAAYACTIADALKVDIDKDFLEMLGS